MGSPLSFGHAAIALQISFFFLTIIGRYVNLLTGCALFAAPAPSLDFFLPVNDDLGDNKVSKVD
jgi:hypothetical protein